jgi:hypothetical protein
VLNRHNRLVKITHPFHSKSLAMFLQNPVQADSVIRRKLTDLSMGDETVRPTPTD